jgi:Ser/Thr protein kinase RdoA (MazF antagonist)
MRPALDLQSFGIASRDWLLGHDMIPLDVQRDWEQACNAAFEMIERTALGTAADAGLKKLRLHGDVHPGNILWTPTERPDGGPHFVDLDDARTGFAVQDLWMLLSGDRPQRTAQLSGLLDGYEQFREFDRRELALIEPLRTLRQIHYSAWLARRWRDPIFPINFPWFGSSDYWKEQINMLHDQCEAMAEEPLYA